MSWNQLQKRMSRLESNRPAAVQTIWRSEWVSAVDNSRGQPEFVKARAVIGRSAEGYHLALEHGGTGVSHESWLPAMATKADAMADARATLSAYLHQSACAAYEAERADPVGRSLEEQCRRRADEAMGRGQDVERTRTEMTPGL